MAHVDADPDSLRAVRSSLERFQGELTNSMGTVRGSLRAAHWNDERRRDFEKQLEAQLASLSTFSKQIDDLKAYLARKADDLDRFLGR